MNDNASLIAAIAGEAAPEAPTMTTSDVTGRLLSELSDLGLYVANQSITTNSFYLKFADDRMGSVRVGDHKGKQKYAYRWNIWTDGIERSYKQVDRGINRWHYLVSDLDSFITHVRNYAAKLSTETRRERVTREYGYMDENDYLDPYEYEGH